MRKRIFKVIVMGVGGVGKSAITSRFINQQFIESYDPTIEDFYRKEVEYEGNKVDLEIIDTAGTEQYKILQDSYIRSGDGFILVYTTNSLDSFYFVKNMAEKIFSEKGNLDVPIIFVANKSDMVEVRQVFSTDVKALVDAYHLPEPFDCSAKTGHNVREIFTKMLQLLYENSKNKKHKKRCILL